MNQTARFGTNQKQVTHCERSERWVTCFLFLRLEACTVRELLSGID
jgi:hypothetical protein